MSVQRGCGGPFAPLLSRTIIAIPRHRFSLLQTTTGSMLRGIRTASSGWLGKTIMAIVMGVLIFSFAIWGVADVFKGFGQSTVARVGNSEISIDQFRQLYNDRLQQIGRQVGRPLSSAQARAFGLDEEVLQQWVREALIDEAGRRMGLGQSDAEIVRGIQIRACLRGRDGQVRSAAFCADHSPDRLIPSSVSRRAAQAGGTQAARARRSAAASSRRRRCSTRCSAIATNSVRSTTCSLARRRPARSASPRPRRWPAISTSVRRCSARPSSEKSPSSC